MTNTPTKININKNLIIVSLFYLVIWPAYVIAETASAPETSLIKNAETKSQINKPIDSLLPFGANLFTAKSSVQQRNGLDPKYIITPGDTIALHIWGAIQADETTSVDSQGNIFLPEIGAVKVAGSPASELPNLVKNKLRSVYKDGVDVYVNLITATPINIFVTGYVEKPGQYSGMQTDSILSYLHMSGGILNNEGSYRDIKVLRNGAAIANIDLYDFLRWGQLPRISFKTGDTILVTQQKSSINVMGDARGNYIFELKQPQAKGRDLTSIARPNTSVTNVAITGSRNRVPWSAYINVNKFANTSIRDGDIIRFTTDSTLNSMNISIEGSHLGNSLYTTKKGTRLKELLDYVAVAPSEADIKNIYIKRKRIISQQKNNLNDTINRLERSILTTPAISDDEASIRRQEATLLSEFIKNAKKIEPDGRVVVSDSGVIANIQLEDGDIVVIPQISDLITISGEVNVPVAIAYAENISLRDYISRAGGFTNRADELNILIRKPNGKTTRQVNISAGDQVIVYPKIDIKNFQLTKDIVAIIFQIAATSSAIGIF